MLCVDAGPSMDAAPLDEAETRLDTAVRIASRIVQQKASPPAPNDVTIMSSLIMVDVCRQQGLCGSGVVWDNW